MFFQKRGIHFIEKCDIMEDRKERGGILPMFFANTHMHSYFSDGVWSPEYLVELGKQIGHKAMLLSDHDTLAGFDRFERACRKAGILTLRAIEPGAYASFGRVHIVGIDFNPENKALRALVEKLSGRMTHFHKVMFNEAIEQGALHCDLTWSDIENYCTDQGVDYICRHWILALLAERCGFSQEELLAVEPLFQRDKATALKIKNEISDMPQAEDLIGIIRDAGGVPVVAHPTKFAKYFFEDEVENYIKMGVMGFEVNHPIMSEEEKAFYNRVCDENGLYKLGGMDHSGIIGGFSGEGGPDPWALSEHRLAGILPKEKAYPEQGYVGEEDFMKLYCRELG